MPRVKSLNKIKVKEIKSKVKISAISKNGEESTEELEEELEGMPSNSLGRMPVSQSRSSGVLEMSHGIRGQASVPTARAAETSREDIRYSARAQEESSSSYATRTYEAPSAQRASESRTAPVLGTSSPIMRGVERPIATARGGLEPERIGTEKKYQEAPKAAGARKKYPWEV